MLQGLAKQLRAVVGNAVPGPFQLICPGPKVTVPTAIEPPAVFPDASTMAPVGMVLIPSELFKARNDSQLIVSYIMPPPPRTTVVPLPVTSQAKPKRGAKSL